MMNVRALRVRWLELNSARSVSQTVVWYPADDLVFWATIAVGAGIIFA